MYMCKGSLLFDQYAFYREACLIEEEGAVLQNPPDVTYVDPSTGSCFLYSTTVAISVPQSYI